MSILETAKNLMYNPDGKLTRDLLLEPGKFGLGKVPVKNMPNGTTTSVCGFCATGCALKVHLQDGEGVSLTPETSYPVNLGMACPKGWEAMAVLDAPDRGTTPLRRGANGEMEEIDWIEAARTFVERVKHVQEKYGKEAVAFLSTGQMVVEEMALLGAVSMFGMGMVHGDGNTRQCMAIAVTAYKQSFGFDAPPYSYVDFSESDVLVFVGANPCIAHPIMWERVMMNPHNPKIIVVDPRKTETAMAATHHLPMAPKSDLALFYAVANYLIEVGAVDHDYVEAHTEGFEGYAEHVKAFTLERAEKETGLPQDQIKEFAELIRAGKRVSFWWTMGVNQHYEGTRVAQSLINLALMTGNIGRPGTGANSITGQCNAMGSRIFSNTTNLLGGHDFTSPAHREKIAEALEIDVERIPQVNSLPYHKILEQVEEGTIKALWFVCTNPGHSWIQRGRFEALRDKLDFVCVQDMYHTADTVEMADLFLPAAGWGEKEGTFINSERRFGRTRKIRKAPGQALSDFWIIKLLAEEYGCGDLFREWTDPEATFEILKRCSKNQPCDISGIRGYDMLDEFGGIQWPLREGEVLEENERRLFEDGQFYHENGKAVFLYTEPAAKTEPPCDDYPLILLTGRGSASQWHTQTRTAKSAILRNLYPQDAYVEINPEDAAALGIEQNQWVFVRSRRGEVRVRAYPTPIVRKGQVFMPMHYRETNELTKADFDPYSHQPNYKYSAVKLIAE